MLIPDAQKAILRELRGAREVIVSRGPLVSQGGRDALELLWEDGSDAPFVVHLVAEQTDRLIPEYQQGGGFVITAWKRWPERALARALPGGGGDLVSGGMEQPLGVVRRGAGYAARGHGLAGRRRRGRAGPAPPRWPT